MARESIPKATSEKLLDEYNHQCGICGGSRPHIHHIDEDASNNNLENLLPLCPNCHLRDQHNPTRKVDIPKLKLFRKHRDPAILLPQFHPIYSRQLFLSEVEVDVDGDSVKDLKEQAKELIAFVSMFEMGDFYGAKLKELIGPLNRAHVFSLDSGTSDPKYQEQLKKDCRDYKQKLVDNRDACQLLLVELLRYQPWANS